MLPKTDTAASILINQDQFSQYTAKWLSAANDGGPELTKAFQAPGIERLLALAFPIERIKWLVSAVGVRKVKARFLLLPDTKGQSHFTVTLFATDADGERLSAYYLPESYWEDTASTAPVGDPIPESLAATWLANWKAVPNISPALFATAMGPLQGYNFDVQDFVSTLFNAQSFPSTTAYLGFGLHEYHGPEAAADELTRTFGLVLQVTAPGQAQRAVQDADYFDMAAPCPPNT